MHYDEHVVVNNYKFGAIYQRYGQVTEEALFGNRWGKIFNTDLKNILVNEKCPEYKKLDEYICCL